MRNNKMTDVKTVAVCGMLCAMAFALTAVSHFLIPPLFPAASFLTFDPKDVVLAIGAMLLGPVPALAVTVIAALLEMVTFSSTGWIGFVMNVVASGAFILPGALLYRRRRTWGNAVGGLLLGAACMTAMMLLWNAFLTPLYMGMPRQAVVDMLLPVFLPFNLLKGGINAAVTLLLYKPLVKALRGAKLLPPQPAAQSGRTHTGMTVAIAVLLLAVCVVVLLLLNRA